MQSVTALSKQEDEDVGRNFNNLSLETFFPSPSKSNDKKGARSQLRDPFPATNATARLRWHLDAFPAYGDELQELHFAGRIDGRDDGVRKIVMNRDRGNWNSPRANPGIMHSVVRTFNP
jgi:hypothetical protein